MLLRRLEEPFSEFFLAYLSEVVREVVQRLAVFDLVVVVEKSRLNLVLGFEVDEGPGGELFVVLVKTEELLFEVPQGVEPLEVVFLKVVAPLLVVDEG